LWLFASFFSLTVISEKKSRKNNEVSMVSTKTTLQLKEGFLGAIVLVLVAGALVLAVIDPSSRSAFTDLAKVAVGAYIGLLMPHQPSTKN
jgi:hypothetical protein